MMYLKCIVYRFRGTHTVVCLSPAIFHVHENKNQSTAQRVTAWSAVSNIIVEYYSGAHTFSDDARAERYYAITAAANFTET